MSAMLSVVPPASPKADAAGQGEARSLAGFSSLEFQILGFVAEGMSERDIAAKLKIKPASVKPSVQQALTKAITALGQALQLLTDPASNLTVDQWVTLVWGLAKERRVLPEISSLAAAILAQTSHPSITLINRHEDLILTRRERQILMPLVMGVSSQEIGKELFISVRTVDAHAVNIFRKLKARNREHLLRRGVESGIVIVSSPPDGFEVEIGPKGLLDSDFSPQEVQILGGVSLGQSYSEIGAELELQIDNVHHKMDAIRRKLGAHSRVEAVAIAAQYGILKFA